MASSKPSPDLTPEAAIVLAAKLAIQEKASSFETCTMCRYYQTTMDLPERDVKTFEFPGRIPTMLGYLCTVCELANWLDYLAWLALIDTKGDSSP